MDIQAMLQMYLEEFNIIFGTILQPELGIQKPQNKQSADCYSMFAGVQFEEFVMGTQQRNAACW